MDAFWRDCRLALRLYRRQPRFPVAVVSTLALAIGANVAVFSVVQAVVLRALPFGSPDRLAWIVSVRSDNPEAPFTLPEYLDYRQAARTLSGLAGYASWSASVASEGITERKESVRAVPMHEALVGSFRQPMLLLLGAVVIVLAAAVANLLSLVLARAAQRRPELAVRVAIGASRWQLVRQLGVEGLLLTAAGAAFGLAMAVWGATAAAGWAPASIPRLAEVGLDRRVLLFTLVLSGLVAALLTIAPFVAALRTRAGDALRLAARGSVGDRWNQRLRHALVVGEIAAALVLLLATTALIGNVERLQRVEPGFDPDGVFAARVSLPPSYRSPQELARFADRLSERVAALPGVASVGLVSSAPLSGVLATVPFSIVGETSARDGQRPNVNFRAITPGYLRAAGTRLLSGRAFAETDRPETLPVALVSAAFVERFLPGEPIGRRILIDDNNTGPRPVDVVGIVENVRQTTLEGPPALDLYIPLRQIHQDAVALLRNNQFWTIRTETDPGKLRVSFLTALREADRDAAVSDTGPVRQSLEVWLGPRRFSLGLLAAFSITAVLLAVSGLYGFVSYTVSQRRAEIGLRMAIGATERDVRGMILRQATGLGVAGAVIGLCLSGAVRPLAGLFGQEASVGPALACAIAGGLVAVVMVAAWLPARRAARIHPSAVLNGD